MQMEMRHEKIKLDPRFTICDRQANDEIKVEREQKQRCFDSQSAAFQNFPVLLKLKSFASA